jgi:hypothetical protein
MKLKRILMFHIILIILVASPVEAGKITKWLKSGIEVNYEKAIQYCEKQRKEKKREACFREFIDGFPTVIRYDDRIKILEKLDINTWKDLFTNTAENDRDYSVRIFAYWKLGNQNKLAEIARTHDSGFTRMRAIEKLEIHGELAWIAQHEKKDQGRRAAIVKLDPVKWRDLLAKIAAEGHRHDKNVAKIRLILADPKILSCHGKLHIHYQIWEKKNRYGNVVIRVASREFVKVRITDSTNTTRYEKTFEPRPFEEKESFKYGQTKKAITAKIDFSQIERTLKNCKNQKKT